MNIVYTAVKVTAVIYLAIVLLMAAIEYAIDSWASDLVACLLALWWPCQHFTSTEKQQIFSFMPECFLAHLCWVLNSALTCGGMFSYQAVNKIHMGRIRNQIYHWDLWFSLGWMQQPGKWNFAIVKETLLDRRFMWHKMETLEYRWYRKHPEFCLTLSLSLMRLCKGVSRR